MSSWMADFEEWLTDMGIEDGDGNPLEGQPHLTQDQKERMVDLANYWYMKYAPDIREYYEDAFNTILAEDKKNGIL